MISNSLINKSTNSSLRNMGEEKFLVQIDFLFDMDDNNNNTRMVRKFFNNNLIFFGDF